MIIDPWLGYFAIGCCYAMAVIHVSWPLIQHTCLHTPTKHPWLVVVGAIVIALLLHGIAWPYYLLRDLWTWGHSRLLKRKNRRNADEQEGS